jgi:thiol-disulfide isomerase/thioredoxin
MTLSAKARRVLVGISVLVAVQVAAGGLYLLRRGPAHQVLFAAEELRPRPSPSLVFARADGSRGALTELRGKVVMVHFWATWCRPCREELPGLLALARELERGGRFALVAVSVGDDWATIRRFFDGDVPREVARPDDADVHRRFGVSSLPDTYLVDAHGAVIVRYAGARAWRGAAARAQVERAIATYGARENYPASSH